MGSRAGQDGLENGEIPCPCRKSIRIAYQISSQCIQRLNVLMDQQKGSDSSLRRLVKMTHAFSKPLPWSCKVHELVTLPRDRVKAGTARRDLLHF